MYISQDPIGLMGTNPTLYGYVKDVNTWVDKEGLAGVVEAILKVGDKEYKGTSGTIQLDGDFVKIVGDAKTSIAQAKQKPSFGNCAEIRAIQNALDDGVTLEQLRGSTIVARHVKSGEIMEPCTCCRRVLQRLGIKCA